MQLDSLRRLRRVLSAAVSLAAIALVMARLGTPPGGSALPGLLAALALGASLLALVLVWRRELAANEAAFAERERAQLALLKLQVELARKKQEQAPRTPASGAP